MFPIITSTNTALVGRLTALLLAATFVIAPAISRADTRTEYKLKAEFLYNFAKFVSWPKGTLPAPGQPIVFCLIDSGPVHEILDELMKDRLLKERPIQVRPIASAEFVNGCHVLFAPEETDNKLDPILVAAQEQGALTVGESETFYGSGGMIRFVLSGGRLRFDVNVTAADEADLKISSQLLKLARTVDQ